MQKIKYASCYLLAIGLISTIIVIVSYGFFGIVNNQIIKIIKI
jgi:hypothetical protein